MVYDKETGQYVCDCGGIVFNLIPIFDHKETKVGHVYTCIQCKKSEEVRRDGGK